MEEIEVLAASIRESSKPSVTHSPKKEVSSNLIQLPVFSNKPKFESFSDDRPEMRYETLDSGLKVSKYESYIPGTDNNERLAQSQTGWEQTINGLGKAGVNIGAVALGNTVGFVYGITDWAKTGNFSSVYDNSFSRTLDDWNTKLGYQLPNYYTKQEQEAGFFGSLGSANFWANDVMNGVSFTVGTIASEAIWASVTGGASLGAKVAQWGAKVANTGKFGKLAIGAEKVAEGLAGYKGFVYKALDNAVATGKLNKGLATGLAKGAEALNTARFVATSSGNEAGIESFHFKKEATENFYRNFEELNGRPPTSEESAEILDKIEGASNNVFAANMAILGVSNLAMIGGLFNIKNPLSTLTKDINKKLFGVGVEQVGVDLVFKGVERKSWQKGVGYLYKAGMPTVREGIFEEGLQGVATKTANNWIERQYDPKYLNKVMSLSDDAWKAMQEQYGTKEGWKEIGIGGLVGLAGGTVTGEFSEFSDMAKEQELIVAKGLNASNVTMKTFVSDINAGRFMSIAKVMEAGDRVSQAKDAVTAKLAHNDSMIALAEMYNNPLYGTGGLEQMEKHGFNMIDTTEASDTEKADLKAGYKEFISKYKEADSFSRALVGGQSKVYGTSFEADNIQKALTYTILQGETSRKMMDESLQNMKPHLSDDNLKVIEINDALLASGKEKKAQVKSLAKEYETLEKKSTTLQDQILREQMTPKEGRESQLPALQRKVLEIEKEKERVRTDLNSIGKEVAQNKKIISTLEKNIDLSEEEFISVEDLLELEGRLEGIEKSYKTLKELNPVSANEVQQQMDNYKRAQKSLLDHNTAIKLIANGNFKVRLADSNPFSKMFSKLSSGEEKADEHTSQFLTTLNGIKESFNKSVMGEGQTKDLDKAKEFLESLKGLETLTAEQEKAKAEAETLIVKLETPQEVNDDTPQPNKTKEVKTLTKKEALEARIKDILKLFKTSFVGTYDVDEAVKSRPDQKDIDRYNELKSNPIVNNFEVQKTFDVNLVSEKDRVTIEEFQALKEKLSQWRVYDSLAEGEESLSDLLDLVTQLETEIEQVDTVTDTNIADSFEASPIVDILELSVNTNYPVTVKLDGGTGRFNLTHLSPSTLLAKMGATDIKVNGKEMSPKEVDNAKKLGLIVNFNSGGLAREFKVEGRGRLSMTKQDFEAIPNTSVDNSLTKWTYPILYENGQPIPSDFKDDNITGDTNDLEKGDLMELFVDVNNPYNKKLFNEGVKGDELKSQVVIYIRRNGQNFGTIKSLPKDTALASDLGIVKLREEAVKIFEGGISKTIATTKVKYVQLGNPVVNEGITHIAISDTGVKNVKASGYVKDGELILNKPLEDVRRTYIRKTSEKNKGKKVPVVVIARGKQLIAFPVRMTKTANPKGEELDRILASELEPIKKVGAINNLLIENSLPASLLDLDEEELEEIRVQLEANQDFKSADDLADKDYNLKNLSTDVEIALNLDNLKVSLPSQKINLDLESLEYEVKDKSVARKVESSPLKPVDDVKTTGDAVGTSGSTKGENIFTRVDSQGKPYTVSKNEKGMWGYMAKDKKGEFFNIFPPNAQTNIEREYQAFLIDNTKKDIDCNG